MNIEYTYNQISKVKLEEFYVLFLGTILEN